MTFIPVIRQTWLRQIEYLPGGKKPKVIGMIQHFINIQFTEKERNFTIFFKTLQSK